jgi:hypothetical protein
MHDAYVTEARTATGAPRTRLRDRFDYLSEMSRISQYKKKGTKYYGHPKGS